MNRDYVVCNIATSCLYDTLRIISQNSLSKVTWFLMSKWSINISQIRFNRANSQNLHNPIRTFQNTRIPPTLACMDAKSFIQWRISSNYIITIIILHGRHNIALAIISLTRLLWPYPSMLSFCLSHDDVERRKSRVLNQLEFELKFEVKMTRLGAEQVDDGKKAKWKWQIKNSAKLFIHDI